MTKLTPQLIEKETVGSLTFPSDSLERSEKEEDILLAKLQRSMLLGNIQHTKMNIRFEDSEGLKEVQTTIWAVGDQNIVLKGGITIPIRRVVSVS